MCAEMNHEMNNGVVRARDGYWDGVREKGAYYPSSLRGYASKTLRIGRRRNCVLASDGRFYGLRIEAGLKAKFELFPTGGPGLVPAGCGITDRDKQIRTEPRHSHRGQRR